MEVTKTGLAFHLNKLMSQWVLFRKGRVTTLPSACYIAKNYKGHSKLSVWESWGD